MPENTTNPEALGMCRVHTTRHPRQVNCVKWEEGAGRISRPLSEEPTVTTEADPQPRDAVTGCTIEYREQVRQVALIGCGSDLETDTQLPDDESELEMALFTLIVTSIREYVSVSAKRNPNASHPYGRWTQLAADLAEQFPHDWINPTEEQQAYLSAEDTISQFHHRYGKPGHPQFGMHSGI